MPTRVLVHRRQDGCLVRYTPLGSVARARSPLSPRTLPEVGDLPINRSLTPPLHSAARSERGTYNPNLDASSSIS